VTGVIVLTDTVTSLDFSLTPEVLGEVDVSITDAYLLNPDTGLATDRITVSHGDTVSLTYKVDVMTVILGTQSTVTKKIVAIQYFKKGTWAQCRIGSDLGDGEVEKQDGSIVHAHNAAIINGELPARACSVGIAVGKDDDCPDDPLDEQELSHPFTFVRQDNNTQLKLCEHFVGSQDGMEARDTGCHVYEHGFLGDADREYDIPTAEGQQCLWNAIEKKINMPGSEEETIQGGVLLIAPSLAPGTYTISTTVDIIVEDAIDIFPDNNEFLFTYDLVVVGSYQIYLPIVMRNSGTVTFP
jgi:hypothetical protein